MATTTSKAQLALAVANKTGLPRTTVLNVLEALLQVIADELKAGHKVSIPGWLMFGFGKRKAIKKGTPVRNPSTGEQQPHPGRPASLAIKVRPGNKLKAQAPSASSKAGKELLK